MPSEDYSNNAILFDGSNFKIFRALILSCLSAKECVEIAIGEESYPPAENYTTTDPVTGLSQTSQTPESLADQRDWIRKDRKAYGIIQERLTPDVFTRLPDEVLNITAINLKTHIVHGQPVVTGLLFALLQALNTEFSASNGARLLERLRGLFKTSIPSDTNPGPYFAQLRSCYNDINASADINIPDKIFAYLLLISLPDEYRPIVQVLSLNESVTSANVISAINDEWARTHPGQGGELALLAQGHKEPRGSGPPKGRQQGGGQGSYQGRAPGSNHGGGGGEKKTCIWHVQMTNHSSDECTYLKAHPDVHEALKIIAKKRIQQPAAANVATATPVPSLNTGNNSDPFFGLIAELDLSGTPTGYVATTLDCSLYIKGQIPKYAFQTATNNDSIVIDTGCTSSMFKDEELLVEVQQLKRSVGIVVGNGAKIWANKAGVLALGGGVGV